MVIREIRDKHPEVSYEIFEIFIVKFQKFHIITDRGTIYPRNSRNQA